MTFVRSFRAVLCLAICAVTSQGVQAQSCSTPTGDTGALFVPMAWQEISIAMHAYVHIDQPETGQDYPISAFINDDGPGLAKPEEVNLEMFSSVMSSIYGVIVIQTHGFPLGLAVEPYEYSPEGLAAAYARQDELYLTYPDLFVAHDSAPVPYRAYWLCVSNNYWITHAHLNAGKPLVVLAACKSSGTASVLVSAWSRVALGYSGSPLLADMFSDYLTIFKRLNGKDGVQLRSVGSAITGVPVVPAGNGYTTLNPAVVNVTGIPDDKRLTSATDLLVHLDTRCNMNVSPTIAFDGGCIPAPLQYVDLNVSPSWLNDTTIELDIVAPTPTECAVPEWFIRIHAASVNGLHGVHKRLDGNLCPLASMPPVGQAEVPINASGPNRDDYVIDGNVWDFTVEGGEQPGQVGPCPPPSAHEDD